MPLPFPRDSDWVYNLTLNPLPPNRVEANPSGDQLRGSGPQSGKTTVMNETKQPFLFQILILESSPDVPAFQLHWVCHCPSEGSQRTPETHLWASQKGSASAVLAAWYDSFKLHTIDCCRCSSWLGPQHCSENNKNWLCLEQVPKSPPHLSLPLWGGHGGTNKACLAAASGMFSFTPFKKFWSNYQDKN